MGKIVLSSNDGRWASRSFRNCSDCSLCPLWSRLTDINTRFLIHHTTFNTYFVRKSLHIFEWFRVLTKVFVASHAFIRHYNSKFYVCALATSIEKINWLNYSRSMSDMVSQGSEKSVDIKFHVTGGHKFPQNFIIISFHHAKNPIGENKLVLIAYISRVTLYNQFPWTVSCFNGLSKI